MKKITKQIKTTLAALACAIIATACTNRTLDKRDIEEPRALPGIPVEDAKSLGQIGHNTKMFTAEEVAQNITAAQSVNVNRFVAVENEIRSLFLSFAKLQADFEDFTNSVPHSKTLFPAVVTNSIVAGDETMYVLSPDPNGGYIDNPPTFVTNRITAGDETLYVLSPVME